MTWRALGGMPGSCGEAFKGSGLRAQGSGLRGLGLRGRGPAQKVTFFEVFQAGKAQKR